MAIVDRDNPRSLWSGVLVSGRNAGMFRPDIEGLRGVAIVLVVLCHAQVPGFAGGFVGVDVFFVISGFLISGLLLRELDRSSRIDFLSFYARRIRRLLPAFTAMALCALVAVALLWHASERTAQAASGLWAALWSSNIYFSIVDLGYFGAAARDSIFLHTWSLGVEEQFYLLWPVVLAWGWQRARRRNERAETAVIVSIACAGFAVALLATWRWPTAAYYLIPFRLWELAAGGACWIATESSWTIARFTLNARLVGVAGAVLLVAANLLIDERQPYPGWAALLPVAGAILLIAAGSIDQSALTSRMLSSASFRAVGKISYSWYLWHWPVLIVFSRLGYVGRMHRIEGIGVSLILAAMSYFLIERPTRHRSVSNAKRMLSFGLLATAVLALAPTAIRIYSNQKTPREAAVEAKVQAMLALPKLYSIPGCDEWYRSARLLPCRFIASGPSRPTALIVGDSLTLHLFPALQPIFQKADWNFVVLTKSACPMVDESYFYDEIRRRYTECEEWRAAAIRYINEVQPDLLIVGSGNVYPFTTEQWRDGTRRVLDSMHTHGVSLLLEPTPRMPFNALQCLMDSAETPTSSTAPCTVPLATVENPSLEAALATSIDGLSQTFVLNLNDAICLRGICAAEVNGLLVFRDEQHLSVPFAESLEPVLNDRLKPYLQKAVPSHATAE